jgi:hypothetical protein
MSLHDDWLNKLSDAGLRDDLPTLFYGSNYGLIWEVAEHPDLGNFEDGTWLMQAKAAPGSEGAALLTFTVESGVFASGVNPVSITLPPSAQSGLTEPASPSVTNLFYTMLYAPPAGTFTTVRGGLLPVAAGVSAA